MTASAARGAAILLLAALALRPALARAAAPCEGDNGGLQLAPGFCATVFADGLGHLRHMVVSGEGVLYVNSWSGSYYEGSPPPPGGFLIALRDVAHRGVADRIERFGPTPADGAGGGVGIALHRGALYAEADGSIVRYRLEPGIPVPHAAPEVIVSGLPMDGDHPMHPFFIDETGSLFVDVGSASNDCERVGHAPASPGRNPCIEKRTRGGIWRFDAERTQQHFSPESRYASGIRNGEGFAADRAGHLYVTQHGRDMLYQSWPRLYNRAEGAELPAEEIVELHEGADYGWPECYFDGFRQRLVLGPEYGGDGGGLIGLCANRRAPVASFPGHWAPDDLLIADSAAVPAAYRDGWFVAFHGSWNRAPLPQGGYNVVFQPARGGRADGPFVIFADGFAGAVKTPDSALHRPSALALGPDGALYVADDVRGRIWRITYRGSLPARVADAPPVPLEAHRAHAMPALAVPPGGTAEQVALGRRIFLGEIRGGTCAGCHGESGRGTAEGENLAQGRWQWGDGSMASLIETITHGVAHPRGQRSAMPPRGGAELSDEDVRAVASYVWALGHASQ